MKTQRNSKLLSNARNLRKNMTKEEKRLWYDFLCDFPVRFRRQEIIGSYIADFYCDKAKLVVELDGSQHFEEKGLQYDDARAAFFQGIGIDIIRYSNLDIIKNFEGVCISIEEKVKERSPFSQAPD